MGKKQYAEMEKSVHNCLDRDLQTFPNIYGVYVDIVC